MVACGISLMVVTMIIHHQCNNRLKREENIALLLSANIYVLIFIYIIILISMNIQTLIGDVYGNNFDSIGCVFRGYLACIIVCALYYTFVVQVSDAKK